jgi:hypothetical protein
MESKQRIRRDVRLALLAGATLLVSGAAVAEAPQRRCVMDALENWYCAADEKGVAVLDNLGVVQCAPGACVEVEDEWQCSTVSGGGAVLTPDGPICDGGCRAPRAVDCDRGTSSSGRRAPSIPGAASARDRRSPSRRRRSRAPP